MKSNPLLSPPKTPYQTAAFDVIAPEHFLPAVKESIAIAHQEIAEIKNEALPTFENTVAALDRSGKSLGSNLIYFF